jgi:hypothetical protein
LYAETEAFTRQCQAPLDSQVQGADFHVQMEDTERRLLARHKQVQVSEQHFLDAQHTEIERFHKAHSSKAQARAQALKTQHVKSEPAESPVTPSTKVQPPHSSHTQAAWSRASKERDLRRYDKEERTAIRNSVAIGHEPASPDSVNGRVVDENGFQRDSFCTTDASERGADEGDERDNDDSLSFTSDTESTDDDSCTTASNGGNSVEDKSERAARLDVIAKAMFKAKSKSKISAKPAIHLSASGSDLTTIRSTDIRIKRRTPRTPVIELILNKWLQCDVATISVDHVAEFLRLLRLLAPEYAISVYYVLVKRIRPLSMTLFKFLYRCVVDYLPEHKQA